jgi:hypothetical protein
MVEYAKSQSSAQHLPYETAPSVSRAPDTQPDACDVEDKHLWPCRILLRKMQSFGFESSPLRHTLFAQAIYRKQIAA